MYLYSYLVWHITVNTVLSNRQMMTLLYSSQILILSFSQSVDRNLFMNISSRRIHYTLLYQSVYKPMILLSIWRGYRNLLYRKELLNLLK